MSVKSKSKPLWPVQLLALCLFAAALVIGQESVIDEEEEENPYKNHDTLCDEVTRGVPVLLSPKNENSGSRTFYGAEAMNCTIKWLVPVFSANETCSEVDQYLCAVGSIIRRLYMVANNRAMLKASENLNRSLHPRGPPGAFLFHAPREINISEHVTENYWEYGPKHIVTIAHGIGIWRASIRDTIGRGDEVTPPQLAVPLEDRVKRVSRDCRVISYGGGDISQFKVVNGTYMKKKSDVPFTSIRRLTRIFVERLNCTENLCRMRSVNRTAFLCSKYSDLGAPIVCGRGHNRRVRYFITSLKHRHNSICTQEFDALDIAPFTTQIVNDVNYWVESGQSLADTIIPQNTFLRPG